MSKQEKPLDIRNMFDSGRFLGVWDFQGKDVTLEIKGVAAEELVNASGKKNKKPIVAFQRTPKLLVLNKTNAKTVSAMYGTDTRLWVGKKITLYPTVTKFGRDDVDAIRVRPKSPNVTAQPLAGQPVDEAVRAKQEAAAMAVEASERPTEEPMPETTDTEVPPGMEDIV